MFREVPSCSKREDPHSARQVHHRHQRARGSSLEHVLRATGSVALPRGTRRGRNVDASVASGDNVTGIRPQVEKSPAQRPPRCTSASPMPYSSIHAARNLGASEAVDMGTCVYS